MSKSVTATVSDEVAEHLAAVAADEDRTLSQQIARILRLWVADDVDLNGDEE